MGKYIFYTMEGETIAPNGEDVNNLQVLGWAYGKTEFEALTNLITENNWIIEKGFNPKEIVPCKLY